MRIISVRLSGFITIFRGAAVRINDKDSEVFVFPAKFEHELSKQQFRIEVLDKSPQIMLPELIDFALDPDEFNFITENGEIQVNVFRTNTHTIIQGKWYRNGNEDDCFEVLMQFAKE